MEIEEHRRTELQRKEQLSFEALISDLLDSIVFDHWIFGTL